MTETIIVRAGNLETNALTDTLNDSPVPNMIPGKTYDFRALNAKAPGQPLALVPTPQPHKTASAVLGTSSAKPANTVSLVIPAEGAAIPTTLPLIQGTGIPGENRLFSSGHNQSDRRHDDGRSGWIVELYTQKTALGRKTKCHYDD